MLGVCGYQRAPYFMISSRFRYSSSSLCPLPRRLFILLVGQWATAFLFVENRLIFFFLYLLLFYSFPFHEGWLLFVCGIKWNNGLFLVSHWLIFLS